VDVAQLAEHGHREGEREERSGDREGEERRRRAEAVGDLGERDGEDRDREPRREEAREDDREEEPRRPLAGRRLGATRPPPQGPGEGRLLADEVDEELRIQVRIVVGLGRTVHRNSVTFEPFFIWVPPVGSVARTFLPGP